MTQTFDGKYSGLFPVHQGGIGTGCVDMADDGSISSLCTFETPISCEFSFFAAKAYTDGKTHTATLGRDFDDSIKGKAVRAEFPYVTTEYSGEGLPFRITLKSFNPFIPNNDTDSSIPAVLFDFEIENTSGTALDFSLCGVLENPFVSGKNTFSGDDRANMKCVNLYGAREGAADKSLCIATNAEEISYSEFVTEAKDIKRKRAEFEKLFYSSRYLDSKSDPSKEASSPACIAAHISIPECSKANLRFVLSWFMHDCTNSDGELKKSFCCRYFSSADEVAAYCFSYWESFISQTDIFSKTLHTSTFPDKITRICFSDMNTLRSPCLIRLCDGELVAKSNTRVTHELITAYIYTIPYFFPKLAREIEDNELITFADRAKTISEVKALLRSTKEGDPNRKYLDMILARVLSLYRSYKISGDIKRLTEIFAYLSRSLDFVWSKYNSTSWDPDNSGILNDNYIGTLKYSAEDKALLQGAYLEALCDASELALKAKERRIHRQYAKAYQYGMDTLENSELSSIAAKEIERTSKYFIPFKYDLTLASLLLPGAERKICFIEELHKCIGLTHSLSDNYIGFAPKLEHCDKSGTFIGYFAIGGAQGLVEVGPDYIQMKLLQGSFKLKKFGLHKTPRKVYYGGRNIGFSADGNIAVLEGNLPFSPEKDITVIFDPR